MEGLGELGFWLFLGMIVAAGAVSGAIKERDKEREKQAMLRALMGKEGNSATEVLAYLRERDAAEAAAAARASATFFAVMKRVAALALGIVAIYLGALAFYAVGTVLLQGAGPIVLPIIAMLGVWAAGLTVAWRMWRSGKQKHDVHPGA